MARNVVPNTGVETIGTPDKRWSAIYADHVYTDDYVNVKQFGAKGDGVTDDTAAIQAAINNNKGKSIFFPFGTYIISSTITTSSSEDEKTTLLLGRSTLRASNSFSSETGRYMISLGETGDTYVYATSKNNNTGIFGGTIDGNNVAWGGIKNKVGLSIIQDVTVCGCTDEGLRIDKPSESQVSSDIYLLRVYLVGTNKANTIGLRVEGYDNRITELRTIGFPIGVQINGGGNFLHKVHPLGHFNDGTTTDVGFNLTGTDTHLLDCYSDGFTTAIQITGGARQIIDNFYAGGSLFSTGTNTFLKQVSSNWCSAVVKNATIAFLANKVNVGYDGPIAALSDQVGAGMHLLKNVGFFDCLFFNLSDYIQDDLTNSPLSHNSSCPLEITDTDLNSIVGNGIWKLEAAAIMDNHFPDLTSLGSPTRIYGTLKVESSPRRYSGSCAQVIQTLYYKYTDVLHIFVRNFFGDGNPKDASSGWSNWVMVY